MRVLNWLALYTGFLTLLSGCAPDENCFTSNSTQVKIQFLQILNPGTDSAESVVDEVIFNSIIARGTDSIFVEDDTLSKVVLPINTAANETLYIFDTDQGLDCLALRYERFPRLISVDCGPEQIIDSLSLGSFSFDSAAVTNTLLIDVPELTENVEVFR